MEESYKYGLGVGKLEGTYCRIPLDLIPAFNYWLHRKVKHERNEFTRFRTLTVLFLDIYNLWTERNRLSTVGENKPYEMRSYTELGEHCYIERHTVEKLIKQLSSFGIITLEKVSGSKRHLNIKINIQERDKMLNDYRTGL